MSNDAQLPFPEAKFLWKRNLSVTSDENLVIDRVASLTDDTGYAVLSKVINANKLPAFPPGAPGKFKVGYQEFLIPLPATPPKPIPGFSAWTTGRPQTQRVSVWFPAKNNNLPVVQYAISASTNGDDIGTPTPPANLASQALLVQLTTAGEIAVDGTTLALAGGKFPVVNYAAGYFGSPTDLYRVHEYLASQGFIVVATNFIWQSLKSSLFADTSLQPPIESVYGEELNQTIVTLDWIMAQNTTNGSKFKNAVDTSKVVAMGLTEGADYMVIQMGNNPVGYFSDTRYKASVDISPNYNVIANFIVGPTFTQFGTLPVMVLVGQSNNTQRDYLIKAYGASSATPYYNQFMVDVHKAGALSFTQPFQSLVDVQLSLTVLNTNGQGASQAATVLNGFPLVINAEGTRQSLISDATGTAIARNYLISFCKVFGALDLNFSTYLSTTYAFETANFDLQLSSGIQQCAPIPRPVLSPSTQATRSLNIMLVCDQGEASPNLAALNAALTLAGHNVWSFSPSSSNENTGMSIQTSFFNGFPVLADATATLLAPQVYSVKNPNAVFAPGHPLAGTELPATTGQCVYIGINIMTANSAVPDLLISGIHFGAENGAQTLHSASTGAAIVGALNFIPSINVNLNNIPPPGPFAPPVTPPAAPSAGRLAYTTQLVTDLVAKLDANRGQDNRLLPSGLALNVNVPGYNDVALYASAIFSPAAGTVSVSPPSPFVIASCSLPSFLPSMVGGRIIFDFPANTQYADIVFYIDASTLVLEPLNGTGPQAPGTNFVLGYGGLGFSLLPVFETPLPTTNPVSINRTGRLQGNSRLPQFGPISTFTTNRTATSFVPGNYFMNLNSQSPPGPSDIEFNNSFNALTNVTITPLVTDMTAVRDQVSQVTCLLDGLLGSDLLGPVSFAKQINALERPMNTQFLFSNSFFAPVDQSQCDYEEVVIN